MNTLNMLLYLHPYRYIKKFLVYDFNDGGRYVLKRSEVRRRFGDRYVRQLIYYRNGYGFLILERIPTHIF